MEVFGGVAASVQGFGDLWEVGGGVDAGGEGGDAVEVGADAYVVDAGGAGYVVDVIDEGVLAAGRGRRAAKARSMALSAEKGMGWLRAGVLGFEGPMGVAALGFEGDGGLAVLLVDEGGVEVDHDGAVCSGRWRGAGRR